MPAPTSRIRSLLVSASVLVGVVVAAGGHLFWSQPDAPEDTTLLLDHDRSGLADVDRTGALPSTTSSVTTTSASPTGEPSPTTTTETTTSTSEEEPPESSQPPPSSGPADPPTTDDSSTDDAAPTVVADGTPDSGDARQRVVQLVNAERADAGCGAVRVDDRLVESAQAHTDDMATGDYLSHTSRDGRSFDERIEAAGYPHPAAENIAMGMSTADAVMQAWMNSEGHRRNILNCDINTIGVGVNSDGWYWTQNFGY